MKDDEFRSAIKSYRLHSERWSFCPRGWRDLRNYIKVSGATSQRSAHLWSLIFSLMLSHGWETALYDIYYGCAFTDEMRQQMIKLLKALNVTPGSKPGHNMSAWFHQTYSLIHDLGKPAEACEYAMENAPENLRSFFRKRHGFLSRLKVPDQRKYYPGLKDFKETE